LKRCRDDVRCCSIAASGGGTDVLKALALGANAVLIGGAYIWGLAVGGESGVARLFSLLRNELELAMTLCGVKSVAEVGQSLVQRRPD